MARISSVSSAASASRRVSSSRLRRSRKGPIRSAGAIRSTPRGLLRACGAGAVLRDRRQQPVQLHRLGQPGGDVELRAHLGAPRGGQHDDRDRHHGRLLAPLGEELPSVHVGHHEVEQDEPRRAASALAQHVERLAAVARLPDLVAAAGQDLGDDLADAVVVLDEQNGG
jgi:hypothetical protein